MLVIAAAGGGWLMICDLCLDVEVASMNSYQKPELLGWLDDRKQLHQNDVSFQNQK